MNKKIVIEHLVEYLLLTFVLITGFVILRFVPSVGWKIILTFTLASFYFGYGSYKQYATKKIKVATILEYGLIALIVCVTLLVLFG